MLIPVTEIKFRHSKDNELIDITAIFLTGDKTVVVRGVCNKCLSNVDIICPISDLWEHCPDMETPEQAEADRIILHSLGVLPEPNQNLLARPT
jgi:hypothetical protein